MKQVKTINYSSNPMARKQNIRRLFGISFFLLLPLGLPGFAQAELIHLLFTGENGSGNINGVSFTGASWQLEHDVEDTIADTNASTTQGFFGSSIVGGRIRVDGVTFELTGDSASGLISLRNSSSGENIQTNVDSGGFMQFIAGDNTAFPNIFTDPNSLASRVDGGTTTNSSTDQFNNQSIISFSGSQQLLAESGNTISIFENGGAGTGNIGVAVSTTSFLQGNAVPEPTTLLLFGSLAIAGSRIRRR